MTTGNETDVSKGIPNTAESNLQQRIHINEKRNVFNHTDLFVPWNLKNPTTPKPKQPPQQKQPKQSKKKKKQQLKNHDSGTEPVTSHIKSSSSNHAEPANKE